MEAFKNHRGEPSQKGHSKAVGSCQEQDIGGQSLCLGLDWNWNGHVIQERGGGKKIEYNSQVPGLFGEAAWQPTSTCYTEDITQSKRANDNWRIQFRYISKKRFRPGGMAPSEWTRSVRAVRDTPVADYSAPGVNTTRRVAHRPPITVSPFLPQTLQEHSQMLLKHLQLWRCIQDATRFDY